MKRKAKILTLLGLGTAIVLGLLYWHFVAPESSSSVKRPTTEVFAEAFGRGDYRLCYSLMGDDYRGEVSESDFVRGMKVGRMTNSWTQYLWEFKGNTRVPTDARYTPVAGIPIPPPNFQSHITYELHFGNGSLFLYLATRDGHPNSPIERLYTSGNLFLPRGFKSNPTPTPAQAPIS